MHSWELTVVGSGKKKKCLLESRANQGRCWSCSRVVGGCLALKNMQPTVNFSLLQVDLLGMNCLQLQSRNQARATLLPETMSCLKTTHPLEEMI